MGKRLMVAMAGTLVLSTAVFGCGGEDDDDASASLTKAQFVQKADAVCKEGEAGIRADFLAYAKKNQAATGLTESDYAELVDVVFVPNAEQELEDLRALGVPSNDGGEVEALIDAREESLEKAQEDPAAFVKGGGEIFEESSKLAKEYGLEVCANR